MGLGFRGAEGMGWSHRNRSSSSCRKRFCSRSCHSLSISPRDEIFISEPLSPPPAVAPPLSSSRTRL